MSMKYTFTDDNGKSRTVNISDEVFAQGKKEGLSSKETIMRYLSDEGYVVDPEVARLTQKAKQNDVNSAQVRKEGNARKPPVRKPDEVKRALVQYLFDALTSAPDLKIEGAAVTNIERMISFAIGEDHYELTLSKKRKPKA